MIHEGISPNEKTCIPLVGSLLREGSEELAREVFEKISECGDMDVAKITRKFQAMMPQE
jgi:hypothetical protein